MYDTISLYLDKSFDGIEATQIEGLPLFLQGLCGEPTEDRNRPGRYWYKLDNLAIGIDRYSVRINGSLSKYYHGSNLKTLTRKEVRAALEKLGETLHLPIDVAKVIRIDTAANFIMTEPPELYYSRLGELKRYYRNGYHGLTYHQDRREVAFYDKTKEMIAKRESIPDLYSNRHILRYEVRYLQSLPALLNVPEVTAKSLYQYRFYQNMVNRWEQSFIDIDKTTPIAPAMDKVRSKTDLYTWGILQGLKSEGELKVLETITELQKKGKISRKTASDLRKAIEAAKAKAPELTDGTAADSLLDELCEKVTAAAELHRH